ncbi:MAG: hypothetical protein ABS880_02655 [Psychrobacter alimentarius]
MKFAKTIAMTALTSSALIMGGCANSGYGYNSGLSNTAKGAAAGAAAGALIRSGGDSKTSLVAHLVVLQLVAQVLTSSTTADNR